MIKDKLKRMREQMKYETAVYKTTTVVGRREQNPSAKEFYREGRHPATKQGKRISRMIGEC